MDRLGIRILRKLMYGGDGIVFQPDFRMPFREMARELGVDEGTIRHRVKGLEEAGAVSKWAIRINPRLLNAGDAAFWLDVPAAAATDEIIAELCLIPGMDVLVRFYPRLITGIIRYTDEAVLHRSMELVRRVSGAADVRYGYVAFPECDLDLTKADWRILHAVEGNPRRPLKAIAREVGYTARTVRRRLQRLIKGYAVFSFIEFNVKALQGATMASLMTFCDEGEEGLVAAKVAEILDPYLAHMMQIHPFDSGGTVSNVFNLICPNVAEGADLLAKVRGLEGLADSRIDYYERIVFPGETRQEIHKKSLDR